jgi:hypothetical protein
MRRITNIVARHGHVAWHGSIWEPPNTKVGRRRGVLSAAHATGMAVQPEQLPNAAHQRWPAERLGGRVAGGRTVCAWWTAALLGHSKGK